MIKLFGSARLTQANEVILSGRALPNSFITLYVYSTPVIVTIKTNADGEWHYILDTELENGQHTVYTATVTNSGKILAQSSPYLFTKTAEAVTLVDAAATVPLTETAPPPPRLLSGTMTNLLLFSFILMIMILIYIGSTTKRPIS